MSAGRYTNQFRLRIPVETDDGEGGQAESWTNGHLFWGEKRDVTAREQAISGAIQTIGTHRVITHQDSRVTTRHRLAQVMPSGPELQVLGVTRPDRDRMELECAEVI